MRVRIEHFKKYLSFFLFLFVLLAGTATGLTAQSKPDLLVTWSATSYAPAGFQGKILPTLGSPINASVEFISGGKVLNLSGQMITWEWNDDIVKSGLGIQDVLIRPARQGMGKLTVKIETENGTMIKSVSLPVVQPEAVISTKLSNFQFTSRQLQVTAKPYFFSVPSLSNLVFSWEVNGQSPKTSADPNILNISLNREASVGSLFDIGLEIRNPNGAGETATKNLELTFVK